MTHNYQLPIGIAMCKINDAVSVTVNAQHVKSTTPSDRTLRLSADYHR